MRIKNTTVESTPFADINITDKARGGKTVAWFKLYWSANSGMHGHQVCYYGNDLRREDGYFEGKTGGYGYCKSASALEDSLHHIFGKYPTNCNSDPDHVLRDFHKGGNYYELSVGQLKKVVKFR